MSTCLLLPYIIGFSESLIVVTQHDVLMLLQANNSPHPAAAMNSASVVESETTGCFFELQATAPELSLKTHPEVLFRPS